MADRELLELAAKAAGMLMTGYSLGRAEIELAPKDHGNGWVSGGLIRWAPTADDGDAFRLRVRMEQLYGYRNFQRQFEEFLSLETGSPRDPYLATRRAIVRTAAKIGRATPSPEVIKET